MPNRRVLRVRPDLRIPVAELDVSFSRSGGPGGQHANTSDTRVTVVFPIASSPTLTDHQRSVLTARFGDAARVTRDSERSQRRNRAAALDALTEDLAIALRPKRARRPTKPSRGAKRRRLKAKRERSEIKKLRGRVDPP